MWVRYKSSSKTDLDMLSTGGAEIATAKQYGFLLHAKSYVGSSGSSDSIRFDTVVAGLFRISIFSIGPKLFRFVHGYSQSVNTR